MLLNVIYTNADIKKNSKHFLHAFQLLEDLALQQIQLEQELEKVQQERDTNRARLLSYVYNGTILAFVFNKNFAQKCK